MPPKGGKSKTELRAEQAAAEEARLLKEKMDAAGLSYVDTADPDDEVEVNRGLWYTMRSMWPGTAEYFEAQQAEMEMDDLTRLKIERVKANDLVALAKSDYEAALEQLMSATQNDFFFFNKLKYKMEEEGKWEFEPPKKSMFGSADDAERRRNRLRRAFKAPLPMSDGASGGGGGGSGGAGSAMGALGSTVDAAASKFDNEPKPCSWRGKSKTGDSLQCNNMRLYHPTLTVTDPATKKEVPMQLPTCGYHSKDCVETTHDHPVPIKAPNAEAYCSECFMTKKKGARLATNLTMEACPGVMAVSATAKLAAASAAAAADSEQGRGAEGAGAGVSSAAKMLLSTRTAESKCEWKPGKRDLKLRGWHCTCLVVKHPETGAFQETCGMHIRVCLRQHTGDGGSSEVTVPNIHGLCVMHHTAEFGEPPKPVDFPYPGMFYKKSRAQWAAENHHWAAPRFAFSTEIEVAEYEAPDEPEDFIQQIIHAGKIAKFKLGVRKNGKWASTKCQSFWRRYRVLSLHTRIALEKSRRPRIEAALAIGRQMRRYLAAKHVRELKAKRTKACILVQKRFRGYSVRKKLHILRAKTRIYKFTMKLRFFKFRDTLITMMQLKKMFRRRNAAAVIIQKMVRGKLVRLRFFYIRLRHFVVTHAARTLQRKLMEIYHAMLDRQTKKMLKARFVYPSDDWARRQCGKKLAQLIWEKMQDRKSRLQLAQAYNESAPAMQMVVRGFLGRKGTKKMRFVQQALRTWCQPEMATEFLRQFYIDRLFYMKKPADDGKPPTPPPQKELNMLRKLLPKKYEGDLEVDNLVFDQIIHEYYQSLGVPLLTTELAAIKKTFANPASRRVELAKLELYISMHSLPCRKHGRLVCGSCFFMGRCLKPGCKCMCYSKSGGPGSVCSACYHPPAMHRKAPLQHREKAIPKTMLAIMNNIREPDTSIPSTVTGVPLHEVVVPPPDPDDKMMSRIKAATKANKQWASDTASHRMAKLSTRLAYLEEKGEDIATIREYWGQKDTDLLHQTGPDHPSATADVHVYPVAPDVHQVTAAQFWENAAKNPNKSLRDYDEKFEHSLPMPIVSGTDLVYTFEGRLVYLNLLHQCVQMEFSVHYDNPDFLRLVVDNIQIFERHWRKMVADLRKGELNRNAHVEPGHRRLFEALALPRPGLAAKLDVAFRKLGFHKKVLGKDIQVTSYAERRVVASPSKEQLVRGRRPSLPMTPAGTGRDLRERELGLASGSRRSGSRGSSKGGSRGGSRGRSRGGSRSGSRGSPGQSLSGSPKGSPQPFSPSAAAAAADGLGFGPAPLPSSPLASTPSARHRVRTLGPLSSPLPTGTGTPQSNQGRRTGSRSGSGSGGGNGKGTSNSKPSKREVMVAAGTAMRQGPLDLKQQEEEARVRGPNRRKLGSERSRRGSEADIVRDASLAELQAMNYAQETGPRIGEHLVLGGADLERFVCPFPACGMSFKTADLAFKHIPVHENRLRLKAPTALADSHLSAYWPKNLPWQEDRKYASKAHVVGSHECHVKGCGRVFASKKELEAHAAHDHKLGGPSSLVKGAFKYVGVAMNVPPSAPPAYAPARYCVNHAHPSATCMLCLELEKASGPRPPYRYYEGVVVDRSKLPSKPGLGSSPVSGASAGVVTITAQDKNTAIVFSARLSSDPSKSFLTEQKLGFVSAVMLDGRDNGWLGVVPYLQYDAAVAGGFPIARDFDRAYELLFPDPAQSGFAGKAAAAAVGSDDPYRAPNRLFRWLPVSEVIECCPVRSLQRADFRAAVKSKRLPKTAYFVRPIEAAGGEDEDDETI